MQAIFEQTVAAIAHEGPRKYARWDADHFQQLAAGPAQALWCSIKESSQAEAILAAYLRLLEEGIGGGYLKRTNGAAAPWPNFLTFCLVKLVPGGLAQAPAKQRLPLLAKIWNLGEGLLREPAWVDRYVTASAANLQAVEKVENFLVQTLEPALAPARPAQWRGPFALCILDGRAADDDFLPGRMHLAAPAVLCIHDRRRPEVHLAVFLQAQQRSRFLGLTPCLGDFASQEPPVHLAAHELAVGGQKVGLPFLRCVHTHVAASTGFVAVSAVDSQRLWIVESP